MNDARRAGFVGLGNMGSAIAERLRLAGYELVVHDLDPGAVRRFVALGGTAAASAREVADRAGVVLACLPGKAASLAVAAEVVQGSAITHYVETSTLGRPTVAAIEDVLAPRRIPLVDSPVTGGPTGARAGTLAAMVSGSTDAVAAVRPVLESFASKLFVVGERPGLAQVAKLVNNALSISGLVVASEAMVVGVKAGLDATTLLDIVNAGTGRNSATLEKFPRSILPRTFDFGGPITIGIKDLEAYLHEADAQGVPAFALTNMAQMIRLAAGRLGHDVDFTAFIRWLEEIAGVEVRGGTGRAD